MKTTILLGIVFLIGMMLPAFSADAPKVGDAAPEFTTTASDGSTVSLKDALAKGPVVLFFYPKDDTSG